MPISAEVAWQAFFTTANVSTRDSKVVGLLGSMPTWSLARLLLVYVVREGVAERDSGEEHFDASDEILPAGCYRPCAHLVPIYD